MRARRGELIAVTGVAGIGKTELFRAAVDEARRHGMSVVQARGNDMESSFSFGVVRQLFERVLAEADGGARDALLSGAARQALIALEGDLLETSEIDRSFAVIHGLYWLAVNLCRDAPLLVAVDDLHWSDEGSIRWLLYLADRLENLPIGVLLSSRTGEPGLDGQLAARLAHVLDRHALTPAPLSSGGVAEILERWFEHRPGIRLVEASHRVTGGNPFLVRELLDALDADQIGSEEDAVERAVERGPRSVARSVSLRIERLGADTRAVAQAVAVLGDGAQLSHTASLAGLSLEDAATAAGKLGGAGLFESGTPLRFVHAIVRAAIYEDISPVMRAVRHSSAARVLTEHAADPDQVCAHLIRCEPQASAQVVLQLQSGASRALARAAPAAAASYLVRALAEGVGGHARVELMRALANCERRMRTPGAAEHYRVALDNSGDPHERAAIAAELAKVLWLGGQWDPALEVTESVLA